MPECGPCQEVKNKTDQCGCLHLECVPKKCPVIDVTCGECEKQVEVKDGCGCKVVSCIPLITTDKCVVNGVAHPINSTWPNEFDPKCSKCRCVAEGKCLGAKIECEDVAKKDCLVFCKEGEWYYPPSKEQCENTCGPCCGKCGPAKCNAESGLVPADKTVEILKTTKKGKIPIKCVNKEKIHGLRRCSGACGLAHTVEWMPGQRDSSCKCCKPSETEKKVVKMTCEDGTSFPQVVANPTRCDCQPCEKDHGGRK